MFAATGVDMDAIAGEPGKDLGLGVHGREITPTLLAARQGAQAGKSLPDGDGWPMRANWRELLLGGVIIAGLLVLLWGPSEADFALTSDQYYRGIGLALISAALAAVFSIFNSVLVRTYDSANLTRVELLSAAGVLAVLFVMDGKGRSLDFWAIPRQDWLWLALLASLATAFAFLMSIEVMKRLSPFTTAVAINMEPVYAIVLAAVIFGDSERMGGWFYLGSAIIVGAVFADAGFKRMARKKDSINGEKG